MSLTGHNMRRRARVKRAAEVNVEEPKAEVVVKEEVKEKAKRTRKVEAEVPQVEASAEGEAS